MEFSDSLPNRLDTLIGEQGYGLSGGQAQRVALARAFIRDAPLLVLDEPTANLDARNVTLVLETLDEIFADRTVIIVTHNADVIARTDRQILIQRGQGFEGQARNPGDS
jgi:ATP-binding cassette subfamily C protein CydD